MVPRKPGNSGGGTAPWFGHASERGEDRELTMSLEPDRVERLRTKLYEKAKREPDFRFYTLYDKVCWTETLERAYRQAKANAGAAGVDRIRFEDIEAYGVERWLGELRQELVDETYRPQPVRRVMIPKPGGGERPLGIPTIRDRVVQTSVVLLLEPIFEADFEDNVYAYRPQRSAHDALAEVRERLYGGQQHVVDADVKQYFDTIPHAELLQSVARRVADGKILHLLKLWLKSPVEERDERGNRRMTGGKKSKQGTPQGGVVSPLLANIYINRLLRHWKKTGACERLGQIVSYADDFVILCASRRQAEEGLALVSHWLAKLGLEIHPTKTRLCFAINTLLYRGNPTPWPELRIRLNRLISGWAEYFSFGYTGMADQAVRWHIAGRVRRLLRRRHKLPRHTSRFGFSEVYGALGVLDIHQLRRRRSPVHALS
jgi:RNA-directed DNA polymerase